MKQMFHLPVNALIFPIMVFHYNPLDPGTMSYT